MAVPQKLHPQPAPWAGLALLAVFLASRILFLLQGGEFLARPIGFAMQYLDPQLLQHDLFRSLLYQHSQPPLFNMVLGIVLKISPHPALTYEIIFRTAGALIPLILYAALLFTGLRPLPAFVLTLLFMLNPTLILYESLLYYSHVEACLVLISIFFLMQWGSSGRRRHVILFWLSLLSLGLVRSLFHPAFFVATALYVSLFLRRLYPDRHMISDFLLSSLAALIPLLSICLKNLIIFGVFGTTSWAGMSLWTKVNGYGPEQLESLHADGIVSETAVRADLKVFQPITHYYADNVLALLNCHHPADCNVLKSTGKPNFNHIGYVSVSKQLWQDAMAVIKHDPGQFAFYTAASYSLTLWHSSDSVHALFAKNMAIVEKIENVYRYLYFGFLGVRNRYNDTGIWMRTIVISILIIFVYAATLYHVAADSPGVSPTLKLFCLFCMFIHAYAIIVSSLIEFGENNRFRFPVDAPFLLLLTANLRIYWSRFLDCRVSKQNNTNS